MNQNDWPYRNTFKLAVEEFAKRERKTHQQIADDLGVSLSALRGWLYGFKNPSIRALQRASTLFGYPLTDFVDDPQSKMEGLADDDLGTMTPAKRAVMNMLFQRLKPDEITDEMALAYLKILDAAMEAGKIRQPPNWKR